MSEVLVVIGPGSIGQSIARRVGAGKHVIVADLREDNAQAAAKTLGDAGFDVSSTHVDISSRESIQALVKTATSAGTVTRLVHAAGVSPSQASPATILKVDLYGTAVILQEFGPHNLALVTLVKTWAQRKRAAPGQIALAWLMAQKPWIVPIPGTTQMPHMLENVGAAAVRFTDAELAKLNAAVAAIQVRGARLPEQVQVMSGVEAPLKN